MAEPPQHTYERPALDPVRRSSLSVLSAFVAPHTRVLDLGTGSGTLGRHLRDHKACHVDGFTVSAEEAALAAPGYASVRVGNLEVAGWSAAFDALSYDCVVCADVLEHVRQPEAVLRECRGLLKPGGLLLVSVPNVAYAGLVADLLHGRWEYGPEGLLDASHLRFFTRDAFASLLQREGWQLHRAEPVPQPWFETEFARPFDHLPPAVADYLLAQPHASVYQWVFVAGLAPADAAPATPLPPLPDLSVAAYVAQLFVDCGQGYSDATKLQALGRMGVHGQTLRFALPAQGGLRRLRLDPADRPGFWHLRQIVLRGSAGRVLWQWAANAEGLAQLQPALRHQLHLGVADEARGVLPLLLTGDDPQLELPVPAAVLAACEGQACVLEVWCDWPWSADYRAAIQALQAPGMPVPSPAPDTRAPHPSPSFWQRLRGLARGWVRGDDVLAPSPPNTTVFQPATDDVVEIIVPVYGNLPLVRRCLQSVLASAGAAHWHLTVLDDASPDAETRAWLGEWAQAHPEHTVLLGATNVGFVATVNRGMRLAGRRDVVLLNSDTEVAGDWLDRLRAAAHGAERVASVTPFSNNATICSLPRFCEDNPLPAGHNTASVHDAVSRLLHGRTVDIPTAVGFCMYIRRDCLDEIGEFDAQHFGLGYGEENDFCMRAGARGWRHLHALDVFVYHQGGASFSERRFALQQNALKALLALHPDYEDRVRAFVAQDPAKPHREAVVQTLGL